MTILLQEVNDMTLKTMARRRGRNALGSFMTRPRKPRYLYLMAFFLPVLILGTMWAIAGVIPFGSKMILAHDQWHQYYPFFLDLRSRLQNGQSLFHSWTTGMGTNYLSLFAYYLASPLNFSAALLPEGLLMPWYTLMVLVRIGLAGLFCAFFLKKVFDREELVVVCFSTAYALCAFLMGYYWNAIWLDTVALLPLVALGTISLLRDRRYVLYVVSLALAVYCSYYIGLFVCLFVLLLFIGWHVVNWDDLAGFWTRFWRIALFTAIALGMTAFLSVPAYLGLQSTSSAVNQFPGANAMNIVKIPEITHKAGIELINRGRISELFTFFGREAPTFSGDSVFYPSWIGAHEALLSLRLGYFDAFLASFRLPLQGLRDILSNTGSLVMPTTMEGLPNIACGFVTVILAALYLFCKRISLRERIFTVLLLLFFADSFLFRTLDYLWHGMHFPNMLPYRFSFLWSFTVIFMAFRAYTQLEHLSRWRAVALMIPVVVLLYCVISSGTLRVIAVSTAVALLTLAGVLLYSFRVIKKELLVLGLCACMLLESLGCAILGVVRVGFTDSSYYPTKKVDSRQIVDTMLWREEETVDLWRGEVTLKQTLNDSTLLGFPGVSVFSSAANSRVSAFLQSIGLAASVAGNRYVYQQADPFTNLLLGIKYLIDRNGQNVDPLYFQEIASQGEVLLLANKAYLSLGFLVNDNALEFDASENKGLPFDRLNRLFREMTGADEPLYESVPVTGVKAVGTAELSGKTSTEFTVNGVCDDENYVEATIDMPRDGMLCIFSKGSGINDITYFLNEERQYTWSDAYGYNRCMGSFSAGDQISLRYRAKKSDQPGKVTLGAAIFRTDVFDEAYQGLTEKSMIPTLVSDTRVEGAIRVHEAGLLYLSIPNDKGWTLTVDGEQTRITPVGNAMIAVHLEPGLHAIALEYETPGFSLGLKISVISLAVFLAFLIVALLSRFSRPPIVRVPVTLADPRRTSDEPAPDAPPAAEPIPPRAPDTDGSPLDLTRPWGSEMADIWQQAGEEASFGLPDARPRAAEDGADELPYDSLFPNDGLAEMTEDRTVSDPNQNADGVCPPEADCSGATPFGLEPASGNYESDSVLPLQDDAPGSFDTLAYLERLDKLLEDTEPGTE